MSDITLKITDRQGKLHELDAPTDMGLYVMEFLRANDFDVEGTCGGICECASCHVYVNSDHELREMEMFEDMMLDDVPHIRKDNSRLSCQLPINEEMDGLEIEIAPPQV